jgi:PQQ-dependent dehydrogenase (methanol/ethanol family)
MRNTARLVLYSASAALVILCGVYAQAQPAPAADVIANPFAHDAAAPAAGKAVFESTCAACHGAGAAGSERAPALNAGTFRHGGSDTDIFQTIRSGVPGTAMPSFSGLPSDSVWRLVSYIKSLSGATGALGHATGDAANGAKLFFGAAGCSGCHEVNGRGMDLASDLSGEGTKPVTAIKNGVLHQLPPARGFRTAPHYADVVTGDGRTVHGLVQNEDSAHLQLETADGKWLTLDKSGIRSIADAGGAQPRDVAGRLSPKDIDDVVAYLAAQKGRDFTQTIKASPAPVLPYARIAAAGKEPQNWLTYWGGFDSAHFSELDQITPANAGQLQAKWVGPMPGTTGNSEATPLVVDGVMYVSGAPGDVYAYDARTGLQKWAFHRKQDIKNPYQNNPNNRGVAVLDGRVFVGTLDDLLIAIDANSGRELWETRTANTLDGFTLTGAPLAVDGKIIMGMSGGELGVRGYLDAYDPATGKRLWRTYTVPAKGEPGNETWAGDSWKIGGAPTWLTGSYDPQLHLLYWGTGNPAPDYNAENRKGDNLYTDSVLAIDPDTGKIKWHYQFTPNDDHDWDSTEAYVLTDMTIAGKPRKVMLHADRNGVYYVLDRTNGQMLLAKPFVKTNWFTGFDTKGRPIVDPKTTATYGGQLVYPNVGGTNFQAPSYDGQSGIFYVEYVSSQGFAQSAPVSFEKGKLFLGRGAGPAPAAPETEQGVEAIEAATGKILWKFPLARVGLGSGLLATKGGVVFVGGAGGELVALDKTTAKPLWHFRVNDRVNTSPISYAVDGKQFFAIVAGNVVYAFALPD